MPAAFRADETCLKPLGELIESARLAKGWSVQTAAERCGFSAQAWRNWEASSSKPELENLEMIAVQLGIRPVSWLPAWSRMAVDPSRAPHISRALRDIGIVAVNEGSSDNTNSSNNKNSSEHVGLLIQSIRHTPLDSPTAELIASLLELIVAYRTSLTRPYSERRALSLHASAERLTFQRVSGKQHVFERPIVRSNRGIGYFSTYIRIDPGWGAFHRHAETRYFDVGTEFFSVLSGRGHVFVEWPKGIRRRKHRRGSRCAHEVLQPGSAGYYRGNLGHAFVASDERPLLLHVVCVPLPPPLLEDTGKPRVPDMGYAEGTEFLLAQLSRARVPPTLRLEIADVLVRDGAKT